MHDNEISWGKTARQIILDITKKYNFPVVFNFPAGHIHDNNTLIFGNQVTLDVNDKETKLTFERGL
jgi:muramoyltetrapeptide carboxypeptidase